MSSSTATSPSTNTRNSSLPWPSLNARQRTASRASTSGATVSPSSVTADASASHSLSLEQKAASRQTLSRHLSQSQLGVANASASSPVSPARRRSSVASTFGTAVSASTDAVSKAASKNDANPTLTTPSQSIVNANQGESPVGTPTSQHNQRRRSSQNSNAPIARSPSWMATTGKKSSLSVPQLASIEGSIADLAADPMPTTQHSLSVEVPTEVDLPGAQADASVSEVETIQGQREASQETMKRQRSQQEVEEPEGRLKKRPSTPLRADSAALQSDDLPLPIVDVASPQETETAVAASKLDGKSGSSQGWISYLTLPRSSKSSQPKPDVKVVETDETVKGVPQVQLSSAGDAPAPRAHTTQERSTSQLDLRAFAAGQTPAAAFTDAIPSSPVDARTDEEVSSGQTPLASDNEAATPTQAAPLPRQHQSSAPRPASWWPFYGSTDPEPVGVQDRSEPVAVLPARPDEESEAQSGAPRVETGETTPGPENIVESQGPSDASAISERSSTVQSTAGQGEGAGWGSWLGGYLTRTPVATTTITYGAGIAPSNASTISAASSIAPEADETLPEMLDEGTPTADQSIQSIQINPLLSTMPASSWSNFFTSSRMYSPRKKIDNKPASTEPENMEVDFAEMVAGAPGSPAQSHSTLKPGKNAGERLKALNDSGSVKSLPIMNSASVSDSLSSRRPSTTSMQSSSSAQGSSTPSTSQGVIKPLTTDKKSSKGMSKSKSTDSQPKAPAKPNLILPSFEDTFLVPPRSLPPAIPPTRPPPPQSTRSVSSSSVVKKAVAASFTYLFSSAPTQPTPPVKEEPPAVALLGGKEKPVLTDRVERLPKALTLIGEETNVRNTGKVVCIGIHGWFIQSYLKNVVGEPTGTSAKFASMMKSAVKAVYAEQGSPLNDEAIMTIPLEGDGTVQSRLTRLYKQLTAREDWVTALNTAGRVFVASHSQGTIVSAMLVSKLIHEGEINGTKVAMLNMCSVSQGPFFSLYNSWTVPAYLYFESKAATELFEFQKPESAPSAHYLECMQHILNAGVKVLFVASLNDQVVPLYSALFSSLSHPNILRAIFIDAQAFETSADFMTNLVVFSTRLRNAGLTPHGLDFHLSEALAGSLMGVGHSTVYDEPQVYKLAVRYLLETSATLPVPTKANEEPTPLIELEPFNPRVPANSYFLPWALRGIIEDPQIRTFFASELQQLRDEFERWDPKTKALQQVKTALEPLRFLPRSTLLVANSDVPEAAETGKGSSKKPAAKL